MKSRTAAIALFASLAITTAAAQQKPGIPPEWRVLSWLKKLDDDNTKAPKEQPWLNLPESAVRVGRQSIAPPEPKPGQIDRHLLPPEFYDRPFKGNKLTVTRVQTQAEVSKLCPHTAFPHKLGCAYMTAPQAKDEGWAECRVIILADEVIGALGFTTPDFVYRHEIAHCNGWPVSHIGARLLP